MEFEATECFKTRRSPPKPYAAPRRLKKRQESEALAATLISDRLLWRCDEVRQLGHGVNPPLTHNQ